MNSSPGVDPDLEPIAARLDAVYSLVQRISDEVGPGNIYAAQRAIERHRSEVYDAMAALGRAIYEFEQARPSPERLAAARTLVIDKIREISLTSPIALYGSQGKRTRLSYYEVVEHVLNGRVAGADVSARVVDDYYIHTRIGQAFVNRLNKFNQQVLNEVARCQASGFHPARIISLHFVGGGELLPLARSLGIQVTCLDSSADATRRAEQTLRRTFGAQLQVLMADPASWLSGPARQSDSACIIYAVSLLEQLPSKSAIRVLQGVHRVLQPGGVLLAGSTPGPVPAPEKMIRDWVLGSEWQYRSESEWRELFAKTPFGAAGLKFDYEPLGINAVIRAEKTG